MKTQKSCLTRQVVEQSRGYASYWEWKPDKRRPELQAANVLAPFLWPGQDYSISSITNDPPDALLQLETQRYGIEVTEIVDQKAVERMSKRKKQGLPIEYDWANLNSDRLYEALEQGLVTKDRKLAAHAQNYDELLLAFVTDEGMISRPPTPRHQHLMIRNKCLVTQAINFFFDV
jgi:hypothetical protein